MKNKLILFLLLTTLLSSQSWSQPSNTIEWQRCLGGSNVEYPKNIIATHDGGWVVVGISRSSDGDVNGAPSVLDFGWIVRLDQFGNTLWSRCIDGDGTSTLYSALETADSGFILAGSTRSLYVVGEKTKGGNDALILKLNKDGAVVWQKVYGGSGSDYATSIVENTREGGGYIFAGGTTSLDGDVSGRHTSTAKDSSDIWVVKLTYSGEIEWQRCYGGEKGESANAMIQTPDGGYAFVGNTASHTGDVVGHHIDSMGSYDAWVVKLGVTGNIIWQQCLGGSRDDIAYSIANASNGELIVAGRTYSPDNGMSNFHVSTLVFGAADAFCALCSKEGSIIWQNCYGGNDEDEAYSIAYTDDGGFMFVGSTSSNDGDVMDCHLILLGGGFFDHDVWLKKINAKGMIEWQQCFGGTNNDYGFTVIPTKDKKILFMGQTSSSDGDVEGLHGSSDIWVVKLGINAGVTVASGFDLTDLVREKFLKIYPNPASSNVHLELLPWFTAQGVELYNLLGTKLLTETTVSENNATVNTKALPNGTYIARISYTTEKSSGVFTLPFIVYH